MNKNVRKIIKFENLVFILFCIVCLLLLLLPVRGQATVDCHNKVSGEYLQYIKNNAGELLKNKYTIGVESS